jgi:glycosyltransferase involved in cell wall biosynthesis
MERHVMIENSIYDDVQLHDSANPGEIADNVLAAAFGPDDRVILYAGTFEVYQGVEMLVQAFARVAAEKPEARLLLIGGRRDQVERICALADSLKLGNSVRVSTSVPKSAALRIVNSAQVLVSPRLHGTNTPLKIYEQLASGRPLVATRIWSHTQVLDDSVCFLVEPDVASLAAGLLTALNDEAAAATRAANAVQLYEREYARPVYERKVRRLLALVS